MQEQDKSSDIEQQPPFGDRKNSNIQPQNKGGGVYKQVTHRWPLTYFAEYTISYTVFYRGYTKIYWVHEKSCIGRGESEVINNWLNNFR